jgi:hypothetical protein
MRFRCSFDSRTSALLKQGAKLLQVRENTHGKRRGKQRKYGILTSSSSAEGTVAMAALLANADNLAVDVLGGVGVDVAGTAATVANLGSRHCERLGRIPAGLKSRRVEGVGLAGDLRVTGSCFFVQDVSCCFEAWIFGEDKQEKIVGRERPVAGTLY